MLKFSPNILTEICVFKVLQQNCTHILHLEVLFYLNYWMSQTLLAFCETQNKNRIFTCFRFNASGSIIWSLCTSGLKWVGLVSLLYTKIITLKSFRFMAKSCPLRQIVALFLKNSSSLFLPFSVKQEILMCPNLLSVIQSHEFRCTQCPLIVK